MSADDRARPADHRYLQVARTLRKEIVDGVYPVGSQLPTEHELCERFAVSRYTVREALRRLRDDNLVSSRPRAGTMVVPRVASNSYAQDVMSINDLLAFASGARFDIESNSDDHRRRRTRRAHRASRGRRSGWPCAATARPTTPSTRICRTEYYINRAFAAVGRLLQRHTGPIFPLIEDLFGVSVVEVHQEIARRAASRRTRRAPQGRRGHAPPSRCTARTRPPTARSPRSRSTPTRASRFRHSMTMRGSRADLADGDDDAMRPTPTTRAVGRHHAGRRAARGRPRPRPSRCWSTATSGSTAGAARRRPTRWPRALTGADADRQRGVVHAAELARGGGRLPRARRWRAWSVNPILPSLRDHELRVHPRRRRQPDDLHPEHVPRPRLRRDAGPRERRRWTRRRRSSWCAASPAPHTAYDRPASTRRRTRTLPARSIPTPCG